MSVNDDPFPYAVRMARWRIERAKAHINHLNAIVAYCTNTENFSGGPELDPETGYYFFKVGANSGGLPHELPIAIGEAVHNLAITFDYLWSGLFRRAYPSANDKRVHFPKHETLGNLEDQVSKDRVVLAFPELSDIILKTVKPHKDGNPFLWILRELHNIEKHRLLLSCLTIHKFGKFVATSDDGSVMDLSYSTWNTNGPALKFAFEKPFKLNDDFEVAVNVALDEPDLIQTGQPVSETLTNFLDATNEVVDLFAETFL